MATWAITLAAEILRWLPAKSILRFRSVSKQWASLCSEPYLAKLRRQNLDGKLIHRYGHLYALDHDSLDYALPVDDLLQDSGFLSKKVLGCSNGMLCLSVFDLHRDPRERYDPGDDVVVICDLSTGARRVVPPPGLEGIPSRKVEETEEINNDEGFQGPVYHPPPIPTQPIQRHFSYGFGFDPSREDYKLVRISQSTIRGTRPPFRNVLVSEAKVYSMKTDSWSKVDRDIPHIHINDMIEPVPADGVLYWTAGTKAYLCNDKVVAFDLTDENFLNTVNEEKGSYVLCLGSMGGKVCVMTCHFGNVKLWKIEEHGHVWTLLGSLSCKIPMSSYRTMHFSKNGDQVLLVQLGCPHQYCLDLSKESWSSYKVQMKYISIQGRVSMD